MFYNTEHASFSERESFNNTILLLSMIKREHYYIVGFSRAEGVIEIAFDFTGELHGQITEAVRISFLSDRDNVILNCSLKNVGGIPPQSCESFSKCGTFSSQGDVVTYTCAVKKDSIIPLSVEEIHRHILRVKNDVIVFLENYYNNYSTQKSDI